MKSFLNSWNKIFKGIPDVVKYAYYEIGWYLNTFLWKSIINDMIEIKNNNTS